MENLEVIKLLPLINKRITSCYMDKKDLIDDNIKNTAYIKASSLKNKHIFCFY